MNSGLCWWSPKIGWSVQRKVRSCSLALLPIVRLARLDKGEGVNGSTGEWSYHLWGQARGVEREGGGGGGQALVLCDPKEGHQL